MSLSNTDVRCLARMLKANVPAEGLSVDPLDSGIGAHKNACAVVLYSVVTMEQAEIFIAELGFDPGLPDVRAISYSDLSE